MNDYIKCLKDKNKTLKHIVTKKKKCVCMSSAILYSKIGGNQEK